MRRRLATGGADQLIRIWEVSTNAPVAVATLRGHLNEVWSLDFAPHGRTLVSSSKDGTVKLWNAVPNRNTNQWWLDPTELPLGFAADGLRIVTLAPDGAAFRFWNAGGLTQTAPLDRRLSEVQIESRLFSQAGSVPCVQETNNTVSLYSVETGRSYSLKLADAIASISGLSPDGGWLAGMARIDGQQSRVCLWDTRSGTRVACFPDCESWVSFSRDGRLLAYGATNYAVRVWDVAKRRPLWSLRGHVWHVGAFDFSADGKYLATGGV